MGRSRIYFCDYSPTRGSTANQFELSQYRSLMAISKIVMHLAPPSGASVSIRIIKTNPIGKAWISDQNARRARIARCVQRIAFAFRHIRTPTSWRSLRAKSLGRDETEAAKTILLSSE